MKYLANDKKSSKWVRIESRKGGKPPQQPDPDLRHNHRIHFVIMKPYKSTMHNIP